ncbi:hypothetical protein M514_12647 [Trichuris suis]|uniref:Helix-turn-helix domain-containing protein n=1 Tax=Trichuris suis TaxID=68888 RepID=A0A085N3R1_9BILA|nr:hypothetical protein M513_12647 [Trichuris suis]KFD64107.1 hypothetical protein M514_12647 [Trichuris suis]
MQNPIRTHHAADDIEVVITQLRTTRTRAASRCNTCDGLNLRSDRYPMEGIHFASVSSDRAFRLCDAEFLDAELKHIRRSLIRNDYSRRLVDSCVRRRLELPRLGTPHGQPAQDIRITIPYYTGTGEVVKRLSATIGFQACSSSSTSLAAMLRSDRAKIPSEEQPGAVYNVNCACGATYIEETGNTISHKFQQQMGRTKTYWTAEKRKMEER